jgi:hypothetical protein
VHPLFRTHRGELLSEWEALAYAGALAEHRALLAAGPTPAGAERQTAPTAEPPRIYVPLGGLQACPAALARATPHSRLPRRTRACPAALASAPPHSRAPRQRRGAAAHAAGRWQVPVRTVAGTQQERPGAAPLDLNFLPRIPCAPGPPPLPRSLSLSLALSLSLSLSVSLALTLSLALSRTL